MTSQKKMVREKPIPDYKKKLVVEFSDKMKQNRTVLIASCRGLPGQQFHDIKKKLREHVEIKVGKKNVILKAIENLEKGSLMNLKKNIDSDYAVIFSNIDPFELSGLLGENQSSRRAKNGDLAPEDISIEPGPTELVAGPAISELSGVGLKVKVTDGKLEIIKGAVVVKKGELIKENVASVLGKLNVSPIKVGFIPLAAYDSKEDKVYVNIVIDKTGTLDAVREMIRKALGFAIAVKYPTQKTVKYFIAKAAAEEKALLKLVATDSDKSKNSADAVLDNKENAETGDKDKNQENIREDA